MLFQSLKMEIWINLQYQQRGGDDWERKAPLIASDKRLLRCLRQIGFVKTSWEVSHRCVSMHTKRPDLRHQLWLQRFGSPWQIHKLEQNGYYQILISIYRTKSLMSLAKGLNYMTIWAAVEGGVRLNVVASFQCWAWEYMPSFSQRSVI